MFTFYPRILGRFKADLFRKWRKVTVNFSTLCPIPAIDESQDAINQAMNHKATTMKTQANSFALLGQSFKLPFNIFADDDEDRVLARLDELHEMMPRDLPQKRFFKH
ncbi:MAG: hypothetical protein R3D60_02940 [Paracoccaceae bacterium]